MAPTKPRSSDPIDVHARVRELLDRLIVHGHGELRVEVDTNPDGRVPMRVQMVRSWQHFVDPDDVDKLVTK